MKKRTVFAIILSMIFLGHLLIIVSYLYGKMDYFKTGMSNMQVFMWLELFVIWIFISSLAAAIGLDKLLTFGRKDDSVERLIFLSRFVEGVIPLYVLIGIVVIMAVDKYVFIRYLFDF